jgi:hypothetical protein
VRQYVGILVLLVLVVLALGAIGFLDGLRTWTPENCVSQAVPVAGSGVRSVAMISLPFFALGLLLQTAYRCGVEMCRRMPAN